MGWNTWTKGKKGGVIAGATLSVLLVAGIAIGTGVYFGQKEKHTIKMWVPWTESTTQYKALDGIADLYNETHDNGKYHIDVFTAGEGGYKESGFTETSNLLIKNLNHKKKLPDMVINNQDALAILAEKGLTLDLEANGLNKDNLYIEEQDKIAGLDNPKDHIYSVRFYSTQNMGIDIPLLNWFIENSDGRITAAAGSEISVKMDAVKTSNTTDEDYTEIETKWQSKTGTQTIEISDETFKTQVGLHELATVILDNFTPLDGEGNEISNGIARDSSRGVIAYTNPQTEFLTSTISILGNDSVAQDSGDFMHITDKGNEYRFLTDSEGYKAANDVFDDFSKGIQTGEYWLPGNTGLYSSGMVSDHWSPVTIGSTSGTSYNVGKEDYQLNADEIYYLNDYSKFKSDSPGEVYKSQGPSLMGIDRGRGDQDKRNEIMVDFMNWLTSDEQVANVENGAVVSGEEMSAGTAFSLVSDFLINSQSASTYVGEKIAETDSDFAETEPGLKLAYETITDTAKADKLFSEPNDKHTGEFWNTVKTEMNDAQTSYTTDGTVKEWKDVAGKIVEEVNKGNLDARGQIDLYNAAKIQDTHNVVYTYKE